MKRVLITGITGFVGSHIADFLLSKKNIKLFGIKRYHLSREDNIIHLSNKIESHNILTIPIDALFVSFTTTCI